MSSTPDGVNICGKIKSLLSRSSLIKWFFRAILVHTLAHELFQGETWLLVRCDHMYLAPLFIASGEGSVLISAIEAILDTRLSQSLVALSHFSVARMPYTMLFIRTLLYINIPLMSYCSVTMLYDNTLFF